MIGKGVSVAGVERSATIGLMVCAIVAAPGVNMSDPKSIGSFQLPRTRFMVTEHGVAASVVSI